MIETIALVLTGLSITASIVYYTSALQNANKARETQWITQLLERKKDQEARERLLEVLIPAQWEDYEDHEKI